MTVSVPVLLNGLALLGAMAAYALFSGADFGGGIWDLFAGSAQRGEKPRDAIDASVTPVWEGNHVWIIFGLVIFWTAFPPAFASVMVALFVPLFLSLVGIFFRGVGFAFRHEAERLTSKRLTGGLFAISSLTAPFFLGTAVGAVATGRVHASQTTSPLTAWTSPVALLTGVLFVSACAYIGGIFLIGDSHRREDDEMVRYFSRRAAAAGVVTGALALINLIVMRRGAPYVLHRLLSDALPLVILSAVAGLSAFALIALRRPQALRITAATAVASVIGAWGWAQYPYLLPKTLTLQAGASPRPALIAELAVMALAVVLVLPSFAYLYWLQQHEQLQEVKTSDELRAAVAAENEAAASGPHDRSRHPVLTAALLGAAVTGLIRDAVSRNKRGGTHSP